MLFWGEASLNNVLAIKSMLRCCELVLGLKVIFHNRFFDIGGGKWRLESYANNMNHKLLKLPFTYLGIPIGANPRKADTWKPIVNQVAKRLCSWKHKTLSLVERVCLLNSVTYSSPLFYMFTFKIPRGVIIEIESMQKCFLWGGVREKKKIGWVEEVEMEFVLSKRCLVG